VRTTFWHDFESEEENPRSGSFIFNGNICGKKLLSLDEKERAYFHQYVVCLVRVVNIQLHAFGRRVS
jgi:hypothetical protein